MESIAQVIRVDENSMTISARDLHEALEVGIFEVKERTIQNPDGSARITRTTKVTGKGQQYFVNSFLRQ